ncbi:MAG: response regulator [Proteobacteria bacterium]|nr:response regulator [Pseudomonadota bacterium]MBU1584964.1 response regulator [Pseudomonadota bacterium]MBU2628933.1 response regulator [Pseudomonadota bacterium]
MNSTVQNFKDFPIKRILIVDDEESLRMVLNRALEKVGFFCKNVETAEQALVQMESETFDLVISDISMPGMDGVELLKIVKKRYPEIDVILMTGYASDYSYVDIMDAGASDYMSKPFNMNSALARINRIAREKNHIINLKKTNQELCIAIDRANILAREAKEASKAKTFFLASMSHEIRTPLNGIVGYTDMLLDTPLDDEQKSFLKNAKFSCDMLLSVVNDILDFSKVEAGKLTLDNIGFDPEILCFDTIDVVRTKVDESKVEFSCCVADSVPGQVIGDPHRFRQVLINLLGNAVKFTHEGLIKLCIDSEQTDQNFSKLTVSVQDSGIGIANNQLDKIFKPFIQSEDDITSRYGGTGLGLAISKNIAKKMGGDVWAQSIEGKGSTFYFTSCLKIAENKKVRRIRPAQLKGKKALLCTTSDETYKILFHELSLAGMQVSHVTLTDLESFLKAPANHQFDIAIIDFGKIVKRMTEDLIQKINHIHTDKTKFDFIACSIPVPGIADTFHKAGFKGFLPKPISKRKLFEMISYVMGMEKGIVDPSEKKRNEIVTAHVLSENKKYAASILLVEDNPVNQKMTNLMLSKAGYMIDIASDGREAVEKYTSHPEAYDLIFMDINMPHMNGFQATKLIRSFEIENPLVQKIPILALTANVLDDFKHKCVEAGMDDFLTKPIKRDLVFKAIQQWAKT